METTLFPFMFYITKRLGFQVVQHFAKHHFKGVITHWLQGATIGIGYLVVTTPREVESSTVNMGLLLYGVKVMFAKFTNIFMSTQY